MKNIEKIREEHSQLTKVLTTATTLEKYMGRVLRDKKLCAGECAYLMEETFGEEIHDMIAGFIIFANCITTDLEPNDIRICLAHDLGGALNRDKFMLPRCSQYAQYTMLEEGESVEDFLAEKRSQEEFLRTREDLIEDELQNKEHLFDKKGNLKLEGNMDSEEPIVEHDNMRYNPEKPKETLEIIEKEVKKK